MNTTNLHSINRFIPRIALVTALLVSGCSLRPISIVDPPTSEVASVQTEDEAPLLVCTLDDHSMSMDTARSTPVQESDLVELIEILRKRGGALAYGVIGESTALPLVRLRVNAPPKKPAKPTDKNPFVRAEKASGHSEAMKQYETDYQKWDEEMTLRIEAFLAVARRRIASPRKDRTSPVYEALGRADLFLNEPGAWPKTTRRIIILLGDGKDSTRHKPVQLNPNTTTVVVVNGTASLGVLANMRPQPRQVEAMSAALDFINEEVRK